MMINYVTEITIVFIRTMMMRFFNMLLTILQELDCVEKESISLINYHRKSFTDFSSHTP